MFTFHIQQMKRARRQLLLGVLTACLVFGSACQKKEGNLSPQETLESSLSTASDEPRSATTDPSDAHIEEVRSWSTTIYEALLEIRDGTAGASLRRASAVFSVLEAWPEDATKPDFGLLADLLIQRLAEESAEDQAVRKQQFKALIEALEAFNSDREAMEGLFIDAGRRKLDSYPSEADIQDFIDELSAALKFKPNTSGEAV
ncbi:MAG: hypothetical protein Q4P72_06385 [Eubacteriales bacterium]|nr:hypothetical protein [Eubacteriales bacterium]